MVGMILKSRRKFFFLIPGLVFVCLMWNYCYFALVSSQWLYNDVKYIRVNSVGVILGTKPDGPWFKNRITAAANLYRRGKVKWLIVSGDDKYATYNEPRAMQKSLIAMGVPESAIYCDYAGFTTLDSIIRARDVFGQTSFTIISQKFHNERAVWLARENGISAIGLNAEEPPLKDKHLLGIFREYIARVRAILDVKVLHRHPHFLGPSIVPGSSTMGQCQD